MITLAVSFLLAAAAQVYDAHPGKAHDEHAAAWFLEDPRNGSWCAFTSRTALNAKGKELDKADLEDTPVYAWLELKSGRIDAITVETMSEDAFTDDRYRFGPSGRIESLGRTGHYINDHWSTFFYQPDAKGHLVLPPEGRTIARALERNKNYTTYWLEWDRYDRLSEMPFASLISVSAGKTTVQLGCTAPAKPKVRAR